MKQKMIRKLVVLDEEVLAKAFCKYIEQESCLVSQSEFIRYLIEQYLNNEQRK